MLKRMSSSPHNPSSASVLALIAYSIYEHRYEGGTATRVDVRLTSHSCALEDDGRGIGLHREGYVAGLVEQLTPRRRHVAIHGLGLALAAMSSPVMTVESRREGYRFVQSFAWGVAQGGVEREDWNGPGGTCIRFALANDAPAIGAADIAAQVEQWRIGHPGLTINVTMNDEYAR